MPDQEGNCPRCGAELDRYEVGDDCPECDYDTMNPPENTPKGSDVDYI